jgi:hypothetical protein
MCRQTHRARSRVTARTLTALMLDLLDGNLDG